jgi:hypothetical protein
VSTSLHDTSSPSDESETEEEEEEEEDSVALPRGHAGSPSYSPVLSKKVTQMKLDEKEEFKKKFYERAHKHVGKRTSVSRVPMHDNPHVIKEEKKKKQHKEVDTIKEWEEMEDEIDSEWHWRHGMDIPTPTFSWPPSKREIFLVASLKKDDDQ